MLSYAIAIDVGIKNLGMCVYDFSTNKFIFWSNLSLVQNGRYMPADNVRYVREFLTRYESLFSNAAHILIERQMRCNMRIVESVIQALFYDRCTVITPRSIKAHYKIGTRNYRQNKERAVEWVEEFVATNPQAFAPGVADAFLHDKKRDDLADSLLMIAYYLDTYSNAFTNASD